MNKALMITALICLSVILSSPSFAANNGQQKPPVGLAILDALVVRPISAGVSAASTGFCIATMPLAYVIGLGEPSVRVFVEAPWRFTAGSPLGDFENYKDGRPITVISE